MCADCWTAIVPDSPPSCDRCGEPLPSWRAASLAAGCCAACRRAPRLITRIRAIGPYDGTLRRIVQALKYQSRFSIAPPLGSMMRARGTDVLADAACVVPVPLHPSRRRQRGFNQADLLARALRLPVMHPLVRRRATPPQASLPAARRHGNVRHAFGLRGRGWGHRWAVRDRIVVLVDDVVTTGATLEACAAVLLEAGAAEVRALTAARADRAHRDGAPSPEPRALSPAP